MVGQGRWSLGSWTVTSTTAVQVGRSGSRDLQILFPKSQCAQSNLQRRVCEAALLRRVMSAHLTALVLGLRKSNVQARFARRTFVPQEPGSRIEVHTFLSPDILVNPLSFEMRLRPRLKQVWTSSRWRWQGGTKEHAPTEPRIFRLMRSCLRR